MVPSTVTVQSDERLPLKAGEGSFNDRSSFNKTKAV
jgi:hypothetical protein